MAVQLSTEDILALAAAPILGMGAAKAGRSMGQASRAAQTYRNLQKAGIDMGPASPALDDEAPEGGLSYDDIMNIKGNMKAREYPKKGHIIRLPLAGGQHNAVRDQAMIDEAGRMQEINEHNRALFKYLRPGMSPKEADIALRQGEREQRKLPAYWDDAFYRRELNVKSDAIRAIKITPDAKIQVMWKGKHSANNPDGWYTFRKFPNTYEASKEVQRLLDAPSLGQALMPVLTNKRLEKKAGEAGEGGKQYGWWNVANYNGAYAG